MHCVVEGVIGLLNAYAHAHVHVYTLHVHVFERGVDGCLGPPSRAEGPEWGEAGGREGVEAWPGTRRPKLG